MSRTPTSDLDLSTATASDAVDALASGAIGSEELLDLQLARVERGNGELNAVVAFDLDRARARCRDADAARARGESWGPLHGLPVTVKDVFETDGWVTTCGAPELASYVAARDADAVARYKGAGAVVFGKTNTPIWTGDVQTFNDVHGLTRNPWDPERSCGGSSGGAAVALATGMSLLELGSDIGGSIRNPAHYCGVFGHKPTYGVVAQRGHIPPKPGNGIDPDLGVIGPMGRSVADLALGLDVLAGADLAGIPGARLPAPRPDLRSLADARVAVWLEDPAVPTDAPVLAVLEAAVSRLADAGAQLDDSLRPATSLEERHLVYSDRLAAVIGMDQPDEALAFLAEMVADADPADRSQGTTMMRGMVQSHAVWQRGEVRRRALDTEWDDVFAEVDVVLAPISPVAAIPHDVDRPIDQRTITVNGAVRPYLDQIVWAGLATMPGLPATAVPAGRTELGLPVGFQLIGPRWRDRTTLAVAALLEAELGGFTAPPGW